MTFFDDVPVVRDDLCNTLLFHYRTQLIVMVLAAIIPLRE